MNEPKPLQPTLPEPDALATLDRLLAQQAGLVEQLDGLSRAQSDAVERGQIEAALEVLALRDEVVGNMSLVDEQLKPLVHAVGSGSLRLMGGAVAGEAFRRDVLMQRVARIERLLTDIAERDARDEASLEQAKAGVAAALAQTITGREALTAYSPTAAPAPRFQDREG